MIDDVHISRIKREKEYHDERYQFDENREKTKKYYSIAERRENYFKKLVIGYSNQKTVLEIGCGTGSTFGKEVAKIAESLIGVDVSSIAVEKAKQNYQKEGIENVTFLEMDVHNTIFKDCQFDVVYANAVIHHLNIQKAITEISRILKPGGIFLMSEPLGNNPLINWYRNRTPEMRTPDESPLVNRDIKLMDKYFTVDKIKFFDLTSILCAFLPESIRKPFIKLCNYVDDYLVAFLGLNKMKWWVVYSGKKK